MLWPDPGLEPERISVLNREEPRAKAAYVLYWMQASQRARHNPALEAAVSLAGEHDLPCLVCFGLTDAYPEASERHYAFMLEGLAETARALADRGIGFVLRIGEPPDVALALGADAALIVCDRGYLRHQVAWRARVARDAGCRVVQVEGDVVVPVETASTKAEIGARTLRPRIGRLVDRFLAPLHARKVARDASSMGLASDLGPDTLAVLEIDRAVPRTDRFRGGTSEALKRLRRFIDETLREYDTARRDPSNDAGSHLSPYLHFGQISPVDIALAVRGAEGVPAAGRDAFLEELIVRRELAVNFVRYTENYDRFASMPGWAKASLSAHAGDVREARYPRAILERAATDDRYWNAAQREMVATGYMHNTMRMYWGKRMLAWSRDPESAYQTVLALNNRHLLDGRDANSYANVGWIFGLHDRGWPERPVFGKVRSMTAGGLARKFDIDAYCDWAENLEMPTHDGAENEAKD